jgi:cleavage and polyadenylation specificity factor subunit 3
MMQSGLSRELFECWCTDKRNGVIIAGYCVEGTLAKVTGRVGNEHDGRVSCRLIQMILSEPEEIPTMGGQKLPLKCSVDYISFSAHTDCNQTTDFIRELRPPHVVSRRRLSTNARRLPFVVRRFSSMAKARK